jgi:hypothetical protein
MKTIFDVSDGEKAIFATTIRRRDHGRGPIEFGG